MPKEDELQFSEVKLTAMRSQGSGGQHVNKVSSAIHLRFDILASSLTSKTKTRLLASKDTRITKSGVLVMRVQVSRSQGMNRQLAWSKLSEWIQKNTEIDKPRRATRPKRSSIEHRLESKKRRSALKTSRGFKAS